MEEIFDILRYYQIMEVTTVPGNKPEPAIRSLVASCKAPPYVREICTGWCESSRGRVDSRLKRIGEEPAISKPYPCSVFLTR
jgi:hypothetical protein